MPLIASRLEEETRDRAPLAWAAIQHNLGSSLIKLGEAKRDPALLEEAIACFKISLEEDTRERAPFAWAMNIGNQGVASMILADLRGNAALASVAYSQLNLALQAMHDDGQGAFALYYQGQSLRALAVLYRLKFPRQPVSTN